MMKEQIKNLRQLIHMNWVMNIAVALLLVLGVLFVYSSCFVSSDLPVRSLYKRQVVWGLIGVICYLAFAVTDYRSLRKFAWWGYGLCLVLLVMVLFLGRQIYGARRWLMLFGDSGIGVQPSELAKVAVVLLLARKLSRPGINYGRYRPVLIVTALVALPVILIIQQPDLGTSLVFPPVLLIMMFVAGVPLRTIGILVLIGIVAVTVVLGVVFLPEKMGLGEQAQDDAMRLIGLSPYHRNRIVVFFKADEDPLGAGWNKRQSEIAVGSGGAWGKGFRRGTQNILGFLPRSVAPTDFIYSVIAEEAGFFGSVVVLLLFGSVIGCGLLGAFSARDKMGRLLCVGIVGMVFCHVFINIAMTVGLMPITGLPLPLLSYGGSFMVVMMSALGIVQSVIIRSRHVPVIYEQGRLWSSSG